MALIETGMVEAAQPFAPYVQVDQLGTTLWQSLMESKFKALPAPEPQR